MIKNNFRSKISKAKMFAKNAIFRPASPLKDLPGTSTTSGSCERIQICKRQTKHVLAVRAYEKRVTTQRKSRADKLDDVEHQMKHNTKKARKQATVSTTFLWWTSQQPVLYAKSPFIITRNDHISRNAVVVRPTLWHARKRCQSCWLLQSTFEKGCNVTD